jgi:hypothetical protein
MVDDVMTIRLIMFIFEAVLMILCVPLTTGLMCKSASSFGICVGARMDHILHTPIRKRYRKSTRYCDIFYDLELEIGAVRLEMGKEKVGFGFGSE